MNTQNLLLIIAGLILVPLLCGLLFWIAMYLSLLNSSSMVLSIKEDVEHWVELPLKKREKYMQAASTFSTQLQLLGSVRGRSANKESEQRVMRFFRFVGLLNIMEEIYRNKEEFKKAVFEAEAKACHGDK